MEYRKKPIVVEAIQWNGKNLPEIMKFIGSEFTYEDNTDYLTNKFIYYYQENYLSVHNSQEYLTIEYGDYILGSWIVGVNFHPGFYQKLKADGTVFNGSDACSCKIIARKISCYHS